MSLTMRQRLLCLDLPGLPERQKRPSGREQKQDILPLSAYPDFHHPRRQPLRGVGDSRFVDHNLFIVNLELRTRVFSLDLFGTQATLELAPFVEIGRVFHALDATPFTHLHPVGGLGFRGIAAPFVVGYVDVGYGSEGATVFSGIDYPF